MACKVLVSAEARNDLRAAVLRLSDSLGMPDAARSLLDTFDSTLENIEKYPLMYPLASEPRLARMGYRKVLMGSYLMLYRLEGESALVAHVFHQRREYARLV